MKSDELLDAIGEAKDEYVHDVRNAKVKKMPGWAKWASAIAACLMLTIGVGLFFGGMGRNETVGGDSDLNYLRYLGPVLPMTLQGENPLISAARNLNFDLSLYDGKQGKYLREVILTDSYVLTNESTEDQTVTLLYPVTGSLSDLSEEGKFPSFTVKGQMISSELHPGPSTGTFQRLVDESAGYPYVNLSAIENFHGYQVLLSDWSYKAAAFDDVSALDQRVIIYRLSDYSYSQDESAPNPTIEFSFTVDTAETCIFTYGMGIGPFGDKNGVKTCQVGSVEYNPNLTPHFQKPNDAYVILLGNDLDGYSIQGYRDGNCQVGEELDDLTCSVSRYESTFGNILYELLQDYVEHHMPLRFGPNLIQDTDLYCELIADVLEDRGILDEDVEGSYVGGNIESLVTGIYTDSRVVFFSFNVTIPAGESISVEATMRKDASIDYIGEDKGKDGYDMATRLGSNLTFTEQTASICNYEEIEIVAQNFGFDLTNDITSVTLDLNQDHYWMEVRKLPKG